MGLFEASWPFTKPGRAVSNQKNAAEKNRIHILGLIARRHCLSQRQLTLATGLRASTIYNIVSELKNLGLVREGVALKAERAGPKETELEIVPESLWCAGLSINAHEAGLTLLDAGGNRLLQESLPPSKNAPALIAEMCGRVRSHASDLGLDPGKLGGAALCVPGVVDPSCGTVLTSHSLQLHAFAAGDWLRRHLRHPAQTERDIRHPAQVERNVCHLAQAKRDVRRPAQVERDVACPAWVERDVVCGAYAEHNIGEAEKEDSFIYFCLRALPRRRPQFGLSLVINEKAFRGCNYAAGEIGNLPGFTTGRKALEPTRITEQTADAFYQSLATALANIVNLLDIRSVVFASNEAHLNAERFQMLTEQTRAQLVPIPNRHFTVRRSRLGLDGIAEGGALLALHRALAHRLVSTL